MIRIFFIGNPFDWGCHSLEREAKCEIGAGTLLAGYGEFAAQQTGKFTADREAQASAAVLPRGAQLGLLEFLKDMLEFICGDADASILDFYTRLIRICLTFS
jgi:hypothetical protein